MVDVTSSQRTSFANNQPQQTLTTEPPFSSAVVNNKQPQPLIELVNAGNNKIVFSNVYLNTLHALRRVELRNVSKAPVLVKLRSNLGAQVAFQLTNENLPDRDAKPSATRSLSAIQQRQSMSSLNSSIDSFIFSNDTDSPLDSAKGSTSLSSSDFNTPPSFSPTPSTPSSPSLVTNTVEAASMGLTGYGGNSGFAHGHQFNQLFNFVNHIDEVTIEPAQTQRIIIAFLPEPKTTARDSILSSQTAVSRFKMVGNVPSGAAGDSLLDFNDSFGVLGEEEETHDFFEINGLIFFFAYKLDLKPQSVVSPTSIAAAEGRKSDTTKVISLNSYAETEPKAGDRPSRPASASSNARRLTLLRQSTDIVSRESSPVVSSPSVASRIVQDKSTASDLAKENRHGNSVVASSVTGSSVNNLQTASVPDYQLTVKLRSRVCKSVLWTDIGNTGIIFDDCVVNSSFFKDFTIWNRSEIELFWILNTVDLSDQDEDKSWLKFTDYDTGEPLDYAPIPAFSHRRIRVFFRPKSVGEFNYDLQIENQNDSSNTIETYIHAVVRAEFREDYLTIVTGNTLDFGDCCAGFWKKRRITLRNTSDTSLDLVFSSDNPFVMFQLKADETTAGLDPYSERHHHHHHNHHTLSQIQRRVQSIANSSNRLASSRENSYHGSNSFVDRSVSTEFPDISGQNSEYSASESSFSSRSSSPVDPSSKRGERDSQTQSSFLEVPTLKKSASSNSSLKNDDVSSDLVELRRQGNLPLENAYNADEFTRIEELQLRAGTERTIEVCYRPERDPASSDYRAGRLSRRNFRITIIYTHPGQNHGDKKTISAVARACTSFIEVTPQVVHFGDADVGTLKSASLQISNCSEIPARIRLGFVSKILNAVRDEIVIPARQHIEVKLDIYPRKFNPDYHKQVAVMNLLNSDNDRVIEVYSTNIDKQRVTFHSLFYHILTPTSTNFIDFGSVVLNAFSVRCLTIQNISRKSLALEISSSMPEEIKIFMKGPETSTATEGVSNAVERREKIIETLHETRKLKRPTAPNEHAKAAPALSGVSVLTGSVLGGGKPLHTSSSEKMFPTSPEVTTPEYLDLASLTSTGRRSPRRRTNITQPNTQLKMLRMQFIKDRKGTVDEDVINKRGSKHLNNDDVLVPESGTIAFPVERPKSAASAASGNSRNSQVGEGTRSESPPIDETADETLVRLQIGEILESPRLSIDALLLFLEKSFFTLQNLLPKPALEEKYVKSQLLLKRELDNAKQDGRLVRVTNVTIEPGSDMMLVLEMTPDGTSKMHVQGKPKKHDARLFFRLLDFDRDIQQPQFDQLLREDMSMIPVRELMMRSSLCRSIMELGQKNINFGTLDKNERRTKTIVIRNNSDAPLMYTIRKSGSIASGDLSINEHRMGVIRGYSKKEIEFVFQPTLSGPFQEKLIIENIQDRGNDQVLTVKANIRQPANFFIEKLLLEFGVCLIDEPSTTTQDIVISNPSTKFARTFEIHVDPKELRFQNCFTEITFELLEDGAEYIDMTNEGNIAGSSTGVKGVVKRRPLMMLSKEMEELIEQVDQKIKIAKRKGRKDKVKRLTEKLVRLRMGEVLDEYSIDKEDALPQAALGAAEDTALVTSEPVIDENKIFPSRTAVLSPKHLLGTEHVSEPSNELDLEPKPIVVGRPTGGNITSVSSVVGRSSKSKLQKFTKIRDSIVFTIEPRCIKCVRVYFRPKRISPVDWSNSSPPISALEHSTFSDPQNDSETNETASTSNRRVPLSDVSCTSIQSLITGIQPEKQVADHPHPEIHREVCTARIYVHEHKNTDFVKRVLCKATVCYDHSTYLKKLSEESELRNGSVAADNNQDNIGSEYDSQSRILSPLISRQVSPVQQVTGHAFEQYSSNSSSVVNALSKVLFRHDSQPTINDAVQDKHVEQVVAPMIVAESDVIDLGRLEIGVRKDCYYTLLNRSDRIIPFKVIPENDSVNILRFNALEGHLNPDETTKYELWFSPDKKGFQVLPLKIQTRNGIDLCSVAFIFYGVASSYLKVIRPESQLVLSSEIDFGFCYVDVAKRFSKVMKLELENASDDNLLISAASNLTQQCFIFCDAGLETLLLEYPVQQAERLTIYIALQPTLADKTSNGASKKQERLAYSGFNVNSVEFATKLANQVDCRTLIGGIRFTAQIRHVIDHPLGSRATKSLPSPEGLVTVEVQTVKFVATIGQSVMMVSHGVIDMGVSKSSRKSYPGFFTLYNLSTRLPLDFTLTSPSPRINIQETSGTIDPIIETVLSPGTVVPSIQQGSNASSPPYVSVSFTFQPEDCGFFDDIIEVLNVNNSQQLARISVRLFVDPNVVGLLNVLQPPTASCLQESAETLEAKPLVKWDDIYISYGDISIDANGSSLRTLSIQKRNRVNAHPIYEKGLDIENKSSELIQLQPQSLSGISVRWTVSNGAGFVVDNSNSAPNCDNSTTMSVDVTDSSVCGPTLLLHPHEKATLILCAPKPRPVYDDSPEWELLHSGKKFSQFGLVMLKNIDNDMIVKTIDILSTYGISKGDIQPSSIDLGKLGHFNMWKDVRFEFAISNTSEIPLVYEIDAPDPVDVASVGGDPDISPGKRRLDAFSSHTIEAVFQPRKIDSPKPGPRNFTVNICNVFNPANSLSVNLTVVVTQLELRFDRLTSGQLCLPVLTHPSPLNSIPCDNWFTIINTSDLDVKFDVGCMLSPDVIDLVDLEVLSRFTNSPLSGSISLSPKGTIEVKVRAYASPKSRLASNETTSKYLTNPEGITLGTLSITSKNQAPLKPEEEESSALSMRMTENIPIRGVIVEGPTFSLSHRRIEFHSSLHSDSDEDAETAPEESLSPSTVQYEDVTITNALDTFSLQFKVHIEYPIELSNSAEIIKVTPLESDMTGVVKPGSSLTLRVELMNSKISGISEEVKLNIYDQKSLSRPLQTVLISIVEESSDRHTRRKTHQSTTAAVSSNVANNLFEPFEAVTKGDIANIPTENLERSIVSNFSEDDDSESNSDLRASSNWNQVSAARSRSMSLMEHSSTNSSRRMLGVMGLRGCKRVADSISGEFEGLYELDLGQQDVGQNPVVKKLVLENISGNLVSYRIGTISETDRSWMVCSKSEGVLEPQRSTSTTNSGSTGHTVTLSFIVSVRGMFLTYLLIENVENRQDTKIVRLSIEVVAKQNVRRSASSGTTGGFSVGRLPADPNNIRAFDVFTHGFDGEDSSIEIDQAYYGCVYSARSMVICNRELVPLEFSVKSNISHDDDSEVVFSLSRTSAKLFRSIIIEPESSARVFVRFWPGQSMPSSDNLAIGNDQRGLSERWVEKRVEIYVNCRLVKDFQRIIEFKAMLRQPQILLSSTSFIFSGMIRRKQQIDGSSVINQSADGSALNVIQFEPTLDNFSVTNLLQDTLEYEIVTDSVFFTAEFVTQSSSIESASLSNSWTSSNLRKIGPQPASFNKPLWNSTGSLVLSASQSQTIRIVPMLDVLTKNVEMLKKEKYILEHMVVYNKRRPTEKYVIHVKLSFGYLDMFHFASGSRRSFYTLESHIVRLVHEIEMKSIYFEDSATQTKEQQDEAANVYFLYIYITDELIHYGTREQGAESFLQLANLLFTMLFSQSQFKHFAPAPLKAIANVDVAPWPPHLAKWISPFLNLMGFFPHRLISVEPLKVLTRMLLVDTKRKPTEPN